jgi:hypothetical protein
MDMLIKRLNQQRNADAMKNEVFQIMRNEVHLSTKAGT